MTSELLSDESTQQSVHSPGIVTGDEMIVYALIDPLTAKQDGGVLSINNFKHDQLKKVELSVCRAPHITGESAKANIIGAMDERRPGVYKDCGFLTALCNEIRSIMLGETGTRAISVIDAGLEGFGAHAHLGYPKITDPKLAKSPTIGNDRLAARGNLFLTFNKRGISTNWSGDPFQA